MVGRGGGRLNCLLIFSFCCVSAIFRALHIRQLSFIKKFCMILQFFLNGHKKEDFLHRDRHNRTAAGKKHNALLKKL